MNDQMPPSVLSNPGIGGPRLIDGLNLPMNVEVSMIDTDTVDSDQGMSINDVVAGAMVGSGLMKNSRVVICFEWNKEQVFDFPTKKIGFLIVV
jgi:hypothetical protein